MGWVSVRLGVTVRVRVSVKVGVRERYRQGFVAISLPNLKSIGSVRARVSGKVGVRVGGQGQCESDVVRGGDTAAELEPHMQRQGEG